MITSRIFFLLAAACSAHLACAGEAELRRQVQQQDGWVGYQVPMVPGSGSSCCYSDASEGNFKKRGCNLDSGKGASVFLSENSGAADQLSVYWHVVNGKADRVLAYSANCPVSSDNPVRRIEIVEPVDSIKSIAEWIEAGSATVDKNSTALVAIALHAQEEATAALIRMAAAGKPSKLREESVFWLGQARGAPGADFVERVASSDPSEDMREHAVFALSQSSQADAYVRVHKISKQDTSADVRGKALFWMTQMNDPRAQADILAALDTETSDEVREEAVFALSQLDEEFATGALISVIRGNYSRAVKEKALFWLGESGTDEALAFIDEVLTR